MSGDQKLNDAPGTQMSEHEFDDGTEDDDTYDIADVDQEQVRKALTRMVCIEQWSPRIIECPTFKEFTCSLNPFVQLGDFESLKADCLKFYEEEKMKIKQLLRNRDGQISLSVETFKSQAYDYMCLTAHFTDDAWKQKKWVLRFRILHQDTLKEAILKSIRYWGIADKIFAVTLKSDTYDLESLEMVKNYIQKKKQLEVDNQLFHVYCCADLFTSMAQDAFSEILEIIDKVRELIVWGKSEPMWPVTNFKLKEALELQSMGQFTPEFVGHNDLLSAEEWKKLQGISKLVDKLHMVAKLLFEARYPTASTFLTNIHDLRLSLRQDASSPCSFINAIANKMLQKLDKYWAEMFLVLAVAAIMDPRCKMIYMEYLYSKMEGTGGPLQQSTILDTLRRLYDNYSTSLFKQEDSESDSNSSDYEFETSNSEEDDLPNKRRKENTPECADESNSNPNNIASHLQDYKEFVQATSQPPRSDLDWYLEEPVLPWVQDFNLLDWWKTASPKFPTLSKMASDFLSIPLSVLTSSDAYYTEARPVDRRLLSSDHVLMNALMCTRSWHKKKN